jgi:hypothetical protein
VTDDKSLSKDERKKQQVIHAADITPKAKHVKLADKLYNLRGTLGTAIYAAMTSIRERTSP